MAIQARKSEVNKMSNKTNYSDKKTGKLKSVFQSVLCIFTVFILLGVFSAIFRPNSPEKPIEPNNPETPIEPSEDITYTISYRMVTNGTEEEIYAPLFKRDGEYPIVYDSGDKITVSDLNGKVNVTPVPDSWGMSGAYVSSSEYSDPNNPNRSFAFYGWFLDSECTVPLSDNTIYNTSGNITLYAKVSVSSWTNYY